MICAKADALADVNFCAALAKLTAFLAHARLNRRLIGQAVVFCKLPDVFRDFHGAEVRAAHGAEVGVFRSFLREGFVVKLPRGDWIQAKVELVSPAKLEPGFAQGIVSELRPGVPFRKVCCVCRDFVSDDAIFHVLSVRQTEVFLRSDVTEHGAPIPTNHRGTDTARDVVISGRNVRSEGS